MIDRLRRNKMKLKTLFLAILFLAFGLPGGEAADLTPAASPVPEAAAIKDGYALLNGLITLFENIPVVKMKKTRENEAAVSPGLLEVGNRLSQLSADAKAALEAGLVDRIFFNRYLRLLTIYKLIITPVVRGDLLKELFLRAFDDFVWNITFEHWRWEDKDGIAKMAAAMEEEFVQLTIYLDTRQKRAELRQKIAKRMLPPPPPPSSKKKPEAK
jgi:hypothetical protein